LPGQVGHEAHHHVQACTLQLARGHQAITAVVAGPRQHQHALRAWRQRDGQPGDGQPGTLHQQVRRVQRERRAFDLT